MEEQRRRSLAISRVVAVLADLDPGLAGPLVLLGGCDARDDDTRPATAITS